MSGDAQTEETRPRKKAKKRKIIVPPMPWHVRLLSHLGVRPLLSIEGLSDAQLDKYDFVFSDKDKKHFEKWGYTLPTEGKSKKRSKKRSSKKKASRQETSDPAVYLSQE